MRSTDHFADGPNPAGLALRIHQQALRTPEALALSDGDTRLSYAALDAAGARVAEALHRAGVRPGQPVAVALPRSWRLVCVMLGILRLGAQVVPLDAQSPGERRRHILSDSGAVAVVHAATAPTEPPVGVPAFAATELLPAVPDPSAATAAPSGGGPVSFVFYTSGTTGRPKGVEIREAGILRLARPGWIQLALGARYACLSNPAFDALSFEVWVPLLTGGCCVVLADDDVQTPHRLAEALRRERIDTAFVTVALFNAVVDTAPDCFASAGQVLVGGEQLNARAIRRWYRHNPGSATRLHNIYGPTETTTFALYHPIPRDFHDDVVPIGQTLPQTGAVLVVPGAERIAAPGEVAELLLTGTGLAAGYRNLPEETDRRFVRLPWLDGGSEVHYRTGDLVHADADGTVAYVGRADRQVKVRGFRIEPGEVERQIAAHPAVRQVYVCTRRSGQDGPNELLAFVVLGQELSFDDFDGHLAARLPAYMRPHHVHRVESLPLNANGKVDQAALLAEPGRPWRPERAEQPVSAQEREVLQLAEEILGITDLGPSDGWIACGGDSLKALRMRFEIRRRWGCDLPQAAVLHANLGEIARAVTGAADGALDAAAMPAPPVPSGVRSATATSEQQRLWLLQQRTPNSRAYHVGQAFRLDGDVDPVALRLALRTAVERHPALRTSFEATAEGLFQRIGEPYDPWSDAEPGKTWDEERARAVAETFFAEPFDLAEPQMLRARWLPGPGGGFLLLHLHHIAVDGWSLSLLLRDLTAAYTAATSGADSPEAMPAPTPLDFAAWQASWFASPGYRTERDELLRFYGTLEEPTEPLPADGAWQRPRARLLHTSLDVVRRAQVDRLCAELGLTRFQVLLALFTWSLYGVTGVTRPRIAAPVANRPAREFEDSVGMFANTVLLPVSVAPLDSLRDELPRLGIATREVLDRQDVALADVLSTPEVTAAGWGSDRDGGPFDVLFVLENTDFSALALPGCASRPLWWAPAEAKCPLTVSVVEHPDGLDCLWEYADDRFDSDAVEAMAALLRKALDALAEDRPTSPAQLAAAYRRSLPAFGTASRRSLEWTTIADGFAHQVARTPHATALVSGETVLDYGQLDALAAALAADLLEHHPLPLDGPCRVALYLEPSVEHVVALLALAKLNVTAVPLDPAYPPALLQQILRRVDPLCVLVTAQAEPALNAVDPGDVARHRVILEELSSPRTPLASPPPPHDGSRPLYALFTSGSTGIPKGVQIFDSTLCNLLQWQAGPGGLGTPAITQQFSMLSFDVSFQEIFGTLCTGGTLHLVRPEWRTDAPTLLEQLEKAGAERIFMPYVALQLLAEHGIHLNRYPSRLREVVTAGEQLVSTDAIRRWFAGLPGARLHNHYGPTETHVVSALCLDGDPLTWPERPAIGRPVDGAVLRVVDAAGEPVPPGCTGDLLIGGTAVTRCYLDDAALNDERFIDVPDVGLFYRSGDRARFDRQGLLHYAGREDQQIKLSGHRLELGSVEAALLKHPAVVNAVVLRDGDRLVACLQVRGATPSADQLAAHLAPLLPAYVRVDRFRRLLELPRTASGKLDRRNALLAPGEELLRSSAPRPAYSPDEARLAEAFETVIGAPIGPDQTFFEAGASSLGLMRFHLRCTTDLGLSFTVADLFEHVTVRSLARHLAAGPTAAPSAPASSSPGHPASQSASGAASRLIEVTAPAAQRADEPIAVVGMAVRLPGAVDLAAFWDLVTSGGTGIRYFDASEGTVGARSQMDGLLAFDPGHFGITPHDARLMDPQQRHMLMACVQALAHAGMKDRPGMRIGLVAGAGESTYFQAMLREADPNWLPDSFQLALHHEKDFLATKAAYHLGLTGPAFTVQAACASSLVAVHVAAGLLRQHDAEVMLAGGVLVDPTLSDGYRYLPQHIFSVDGHCRAFSDDASGTVGASGVGVVVLKPLSLARRDGDTVYAVVTGSAVNNDGADKLGYSAPSLAGQREVIRAALARAGRTGADLGYVEAHGTGTRLGDPVEVGALRQAFDVYESGRVALSTVKSQLGHLGAAAGVVGLVRAVLAVHHGVVPPTIGFRAFNQQIGSDPAPFYVPSSAQPWPDDRQRVAAVSSFGIGGTNAHLVLEGTVGRFDAREAANQEGVGTRGQSAPDMDPARHDAVTPAHQPDTLQHTVPRCLVLSASSEAALRADTERTADYLEAHPEAYERVLRHLQAGRPAHRLRVAAACVDAEAAVRWLRSAPPIQRVTDEPGEAAGAADRPAEELAAAWGSGQRVDWSPGPAQAPWDFPPPAFALADYDFPRPARPVPVDVRQDDAPRRRPESDWLHQPHWVRLGRAATVTRRRSPRIAVLVTNDLLPAEAFVPFHATHGRVVQVIAADGFACLGPDSFKADPADPESLRRLLDALSAEGEENVGQVGLDWLHALPLSVDGPMEPQTLDRARWACLDTSAALLQVLDGRDDLPRTRVWWLSYRARPVDGDVERPEFGLLAGPVTVAPQEFAVDGHWLDLPGADLADWAAPVAALLAAASTAPEAASSALPADLALRHGYWWRQVTTPVPGNQAPRADLPVAGVHLVLGGTGGIGRNIAAWLLEQTSGRVLLLSRKPCLPDELAPWADRVELVAADLADTPAEQIMAAIEERTDRLDSIIHAAGAPSGGLIKHRNTEAMRVASAAARQGAFLAERLIARYRPALAVYCSSMSAQFGGLGQFDYAASAGLLNSFAHHRGDDLDRALRQRGLDGAGRSREGSPGSISRDPATVRITIDWDVWREAGMAVQALTADARHQAHLAVGLTVEEGQRVFEQAVTLQVPHLLVSTTDLEASRVFYAPRAKDPVGRAEADSGPTPAHATNGTHLAITEGAAAALLDRWLRELTDIEVLDADAPLYDLGADSLTMLELISKIEGHFGVQLDLSRFSHQVSLTEILRHLEQAAPAATGPRATHSTPPRALAHEQAQVTLDLWQEGTGTSVLCLIHPVGGDVQSYRTLVAALGPEPTVCLIADPALWQPEAPRWSLAERARHYDSALRARYGGPEWSLRLAGWSFGARVAMEMAHLAESAGEPVDGLYLLDPPPPQAADLVAGYGETHLETVFAAELAQRTGVPATGNAHVYAERLARCCRANLRSLADHTVSPLDTTPTHLWLATRPTDGLPSPGAPQDVARQWRTLLPDTAVQHLLDTTHHGIVQPPHAHTVAEAIHAALPESAPAHPSAQTTENRRNSP
jgi:amino acid adenylation domain-containing protein